MKARSIWNLLKKSPFFFCLSIFFLLGNSQAQKENNSTTTVVVGRIPGEYLENTSKNKHYLGYIKIEDRIISEVKKLSYWEANREQLEKKFPPSTKIILARGDSFDVLYPGLIDLHNHTKQNILGIWKDAQGQFENRFEWRAWGRYKNAISGNMNPWIQYGKPVTCAAFRWSEMQAMVLGTTYLQGPSTCVSNFAIHRIEDKNAYISQKAAIQAPTDIIVPGDMVFVWNTLRPIIQKGKSYEEALAQVLTEGVGDWKACPKLKGKLSAENINTAEILKILSDKEKLKETCEIKSEEDEKKAPKKFLRYVHWIHKKIAAKKNYFLEENNPSALITHLGEGRRNDFYNKKEFEILELLGLVRPYVNLIHGMGVDYNGMLKMAENKMGFIWSPFSNLLLYGETLDLAAIRKAEQKTKKKILIALGGDWVPTGTKSVLEELIVARNYVKKNRLDKDFDSEALYKMITENPAKMIRHWEIDSEKGEHGIGRIAVGAMASIIALTNNNPDPYENIVWHSQAKDVNLVLVDGKALYGNLSYLEPIAFKAEEYELLPHYLGPQKELSEMKAIPIPQEEKMNKEQKEKHLKDLAIFALKNLVPSPVVDHCKFKEKKFFMHQNSKEESLSDFKESTEMNLDRFTHIQALLAVNLLTQSRNKLRRKPDAAVKYFPPLYSCNDKGYGEIDHLDRVRGMIKIEGSDRNEQDLFHRNKLREELKLGSTITRLEESYKD